MKQKIYTLGIMIFIMTGVFSGCGKKEVDYNLEENGNKENADSNLTQFQNAEKWKEDLNVTDKSNTEKTVIVDADIVIPDIDKMSVIEVERAENTESFRENFMNSFFGDNEIYYYDEKHYTKEELERIIVSMEEVLANPNYDSKSRDDLEEMLETEREYYKNATDSYTAAKDLKSCNNFLGQRDDMLYETLFFDDSISVYPKEEEYYGPEIFKDYDQVYPTMDRNDEITENSSNECKYSLEEAKEIAEGFMKDIGKSNQICTKETQIVWYGDNYDESGKKTDGNSVVYGYLLTYCTGINDMVFSQFPNFLSFDVSAEDNEYLGEVYNGDEMTFMVTDKGIVEIEMNAPINIRNISGSVELLSLENIKDIIRNELQENGNKYDFTNDRIFDHMQLMYLKVKDDSNEGIFSYVPVWCLSQKMDDTTYSHPVFVNAMDGSVMYLNDIT